MFTKQVSGQWTPGFPSWPPSPSRSDNSRKDLVTGPIRGSCALQGVRLFSDAAPDDLSGGDFDGLLQLERDAGTTGSLQARLAPHPPKLQLLARFPRQWGGCGRFQLSALGPRLRVAANSSSAPTANGLARAQKGIAFASLRL
jgi:hypothetical protein